MKRFAGILLWTVLFFALLLAVDQLLVRVPLEVRGLKEIRTFYVDFRARMFRLQLPSFGERHETAGKPEKSEPKEKWDRGEKQIGKGRETGEVRTTQTPPASEVSPRFVYTDAAGTLHFADSLEEIPAKYRQEAKRLEP